MGLLKSIFVKPILRVANDNSYNKKQKTLPNISYNQVGKEMKKAHKSGYLIDGKKRYQIVLKNNSAKLSQKHDRSRDFINDL